MVAEVAEPLMFEALVEVYLGDDNSSAALRRGDEVPFAVPDAGPHPVHPRRLVSARHQEDAIVESSSASQGIVAAPNRDRYDLGAPFGQFPRHLGEEQVVADHDAKLAETSFENRVVAAGRISFARF